MHTLLHTYILIHTHSRIHICIYIGGPEHMSMHLHTHMHTHIYAHATQAYTHTRVITYTHTQNYPGPQPAVVLLVLLLVCILFCVRVAGPCFSDAASLIWISSWSLSISVSPFLALSIVSFPILSFLRSLFFVFPSHVWSSLIIQKI